MGRTEKQGHAPLLDASGFALLRLEQTRLLLPRQDIRILELTLDVERSDPPPWGVGWIMFGSQRCPVYCPSMDLAWLDYVQEGRPICAVVAASGQNFGLLCGEATLLQTPDIAFHELPPAMALPNLPFHRLAICDGALACVSSAARILADLPHARADESAFTPEACE